MATVLLINFLLIQYEMIKCSVGWVVCGVSSKQCVITSVLRLAWEFAFMIPDSLLTQKKGGECICGWSITLKEKLCVVTSVVWGGLLILVGESGSDSQS